MYDIYLCPYFKGLYRKNPFSVFRDIFNRTTWQKYGNKVR